MTTAIRRALATTSLSTALLLGAAPAAEAVPFFCVNISFEFRGTPVSVTFCMPFAET